MQQQGSTPGDAGAYLDGKQQQHEQPQGQELLAQTPLGTDIYKDGEGADLDLAQDGGGDEFPGALENDKGNKTARALELQEKNRYDALDLSGGLFRSTSRADLIFEGRKK